MGLLTKRTVVLAKIEGTYGTDSVPTGADNAIMAFEPEITINSDMKERYPANVDLSRFPELRGKTSCKIKFLTELKGSGTAGTAPKTDPLFRACGHSVTTVSSTSVTYKPRSTSMESCTIYFYVDGIRYDVVGCVGSYEMELTAGEVGKINWTFSGLYEIPTDQSLVSPTFETNTPEIVKGTTYTFGSYAAIIESLTLMPQNDVVERPDFNQTEALKGFQITGRNPEGSMTIEAVLRAESNADFLDYFHSRTLKALSFELGGTAGNIATITAAKCYCRAPVVGDRDGIRTFEIPFQIARDSGNDEFSIAFT